MFGKGEERRDHVYIDDVTGVILLCLKKNFFGDLNIATGKLYSFYNIAKACIKKIKILRLISYQELGLCHIMDIENLM